MIVEAKEMLMEPGNATMGRPAPATWIPRRAAGR
jgi:hypothetical protein